MVQPIPRDDLLNELRRLAAGLGETPTAREMKQQGEYDVAGYYREFGSWNDALTAAGLGVNKTYNLPTKALLNELTRLKDRLGAPPSKSDMEQYGSFSSRPYLQRYGSWNNALRAAGLDVNQHMNPSRHELLAEIKRMANQLDRSPTGEDMENSGRYGRSAYYDEFGTWHDAIDAAGLEPTEARPGEGENIYYGPGWTESTRQKARQKHGKRCVDCGMTDENHKRETGASLHVHHLCKARGNTNPAVVNAQRNLVALCSTCHKVWEKYAPGTPPEVSPSIGAHNLGLDSVETPLTKSSE